MKILIESDPEVRELVEHMTRVLGLPRFMQQFSVHFKAGEPIRVDVSYIPASKTEETAQTVKEWIEKNVH